ncbi:hypothetical protein POM88_015360 [Heracleum sosnowskyi]|uniref:C2H2-type domain-containing protein n=1 Tax=Heracleum sosnowskyi TaxID=360622 RepID=A0AAD8MW80_9APIA|nr:hypothetical protein POM88_015360 [Heracleum sosnowskyi]
MAAPSSETLSGMIEEELMNNKKQELPHSPGEGASSVMASSPPSAAEKKKRKHSGNPSPDAEIVALSPETLMATNRFWCDVCEKGFQREQNLQLHRRGHNLPWKLKKKTSDEIRKKAHNKICGTKEYKCECGTTFSRRDNFLSHRSICNALDEEAAGHTINSYPYSMPSSVLANASNPGSMSLQVWGAGSLISPGNHQQLPSLSGIGASRPNTFTSSLSRQSIGSSFHPIQPPNMSLHPFQESELSFPRVPNFSGVHCFPNLGFNGRADLKSPQNDISFSGLLMNTEASAYNVLNSTPYNPQLSATAILQKATLTGANSTNAALMKSIGSSLTGGVRFYSYGGALGDGMSGGGRGVGSNFQGYDNFNVSGGSTYGSAGGYGGGMEYFGDQMNASSGGINADGMLVGEVNNNVVVEPQMNVQSDEYCAKLTRDFLGMGKRMSSLSGGVMEDDHNNGNGMGTNSPDSETTISADEVRPFVPGGRPGF